MLLTSDPVYDILTQTSHKGTGDESKGYAFSLGDAIRRFASRSEQAQDGCVFGEFVDGCRGWMRAAGGEPCACASQGLNEPLA